MAANRACDKREIPKVSASGTFDPRFFLPTLLPLCVAHLGSPELQVKMVAHHTISPGSTRRDHAQHSPEPPQLHHP